MEKTYLYSLYKYRHKKRQAFNVEYIITHEPLYMSTDKEKLAYLASYLNKKAEEKELTIGEIRSIILELTWKD